MRGVPAALLLLLVVVPAAGAQTGAPEPVVGGGSFNAAPELEPGVYSDTVLPGEGTFYRVELAKGQRLEVDTLFDTSGFELLPGEPGFVPGLNSILYDVKIYTPVRQEVVDDEQEASGDVEGQRVSVQSQLALGFEDVLSGDYTDSDFNGPGAYYIALFTNDILAGAPNVEIPTQLRVEVGGAPEPSSREYHPPLIPAADARTGARTPADGDDEGSGTGAATVVGLGVLALAGGMLLGAVAGRRRMS